MGDPRQFSAVGRGGIFALLADGLDPARVIELERVHRFTHPWERDASLALRRGDASVVEVYADHGRLHAGTPERLQRELIAHWWRARQGGGEVLICAPTTDTVARLNRRAQHQRVIAGELDPRRGQTRLRDGNPGLVGDEVVTRHNDRALRTNRGHHVRNRDRWNIDTVHPDGALTVVGPTGWVTLPVGYVTDHVELGYAQTSHAAQGHTVDTSLLYLNRATDLAGIYVPLTRGRHDNHAYLTHDPADPHPVDPADLLAEHLARGWADSPAHTRHAELHTPPGQDTDPRLAVQTVNPAVLDQLRITAARHRSAITDIEHALSETPNRRRALIDQRQRLHAERAARTAQLAAAEADLARHDTPLRRRLQPRRAAHARDEHRRAQTHVDNLNQRLDTTERDLATLDAKHAAARRDATRLPALRAGLNATLDRLHHAEHANELNGLPTSNHPARARGLNRSQGVDDSAGIEL